jgi:DNA-binding CsgD family transcriptional regulator
VFDGVVHKVQQQLPKAVAVAGHAEFLACAQADPDSLGPCQALAIAAGFSMTFATSPWTLAAAPRLKSAASPMFRSGTRYVWAASENSCPASLIRMTSTLTDRERQVFELLGEGRGTRQIANLLHINMKTVQAYYVRIREKFHLATANELLREAVRFHDSTHKN